MPLATKDSAADCSVPDCTTTLGGHTLAKIGLVLEVNITLAFKVNVDTVPDHVIRTGRGVRAVVRFNVLVLSPMVVKALYSLSSF